MNPRFSFAVRLGSRLYLRIWMAVVLAFAVLIFLVGLVWHTQKEPPLREVLIRNQMGEVVGIGEAHAPPALSPFGPGPAGHSGRPHDRPALSPFGPGPEGRDGRAHDLLDGLPDMRYDFIVHMMDGQDLHVQMPSMRRGAPWYRPPLGVFWMLGFVGLAVALATYPIVRRLTRRLEQLQQGVEQWGDGNLSARVPVLGHDEVGYLAERFNIAAARIEALVNAHKALLANASHELRSPLTRIRMGLELMNTQEDQRRQHDEISRSISELDQLIGEILLASRLDAPQADVGEFEPLDLTGLLAEECAAFDVPLEAQSVSVQGVPKLLRRLVRNLLENARRYSQGEIQVSLQVLGARAVLCVMDRGPGVPADQRERIFEPFYRLRGASERDGGVGLGLALVRSIAQRHGGQVRCEARAGGGASFVVELPRIDGLFSADSSIAS